MSNESIDRTPRESVEDVKTTRPADEVLEGWVQDHYNPADVPLARDDEAYLFGQAAEKLKSKTGLDFFEIRLLTPSQFEELAQILAKNSIKVEDIASAKVPFRTMERKMGFLYAVGLRPFEEIG